MVGPYLLLITQKAHDRAVHALIYEKAHGRSILALDLLREPVVVPYFCLISQKALDLSESP